jgi:hypothetical protein
MSTLREAAQQALEALEATHYDVGSAEKQRLQVMDAITALRAALAQEEQDTNPHQHAVDDWRLHGGPGETRSAQTSCDIAEDGVCEVIDCCRNSTQEEQEPVAWSPSLTYPNYEKERVWLNGKPRQEDVEYWSENGNGITYVYNHPPRREWRSLSEEDFDRICDNHATLQGAARAIEAKLKEKNQ